MHIFIISLICLTILVAVKKLKIDWCSPCGIYCIMWCAFSLISVLYQYKNYKMSYYGIYWILLSCVLVLCVGYGMRNVKVKADRHALGDITSSEIKNLKKILIIVSLLGLLKPIFDVVANGFSILDFFNLKKWAQISTVLTDNRYDENLSYSVVVQILGVFMYLAPLLGGYLFAMIKRKKILCLASVIPSVINVFITSAKLGALSAVFTFFIGWVIGYVRKEKISIRLTFKRVIKLIVCLILLVALFYLFMLWRTHDFSVAMQKEILDKFVVYAFGQVYAFDYWVANEFQFGHYGLGVNTFMSIFDTLGLVQRQLGVYDMVNGLETNVFTGFRGLIADYGVVGAQVFIVASTFIGQYLYKKLKTRRISCLSLGFLSSIYFFIIFSLFVSPWSYTSYILVFILFTIVLKISSRKGRHIIKGRYVRIKSNE